MPFGLRAPIVIALSILVPIAAIFLAFQAPIRWEDFTFDLESDWTNDLRARSPMLQSAASNSTKRVMATKTPIFLCVIAPSQMSYKIFTLRFMLKHHTAFPMVV